MTLSALGTFYIYPFFSEAIWNQIPVKKRHQLLLIYDFSVEKKGNKRGKTEKREGNRMERILQVFKGSVSACSSFSNSFC